MLEIEQPKNWERVDAYFRLVLGSAKHSISLAHGELAGGIESCASGMQIALEGILMQAGNIRLNAGITSDRAVLDELVASADRLLERLSGEHEASGNRGGDHKRS